MSKFIELPSFRDYGRYNKYEIKPSPRRYIEAWCPIDLTKWGKDTLYYYFDGNKTHKIIIRTVSARDTGKRIVLNCSYEDGTKLRITLPYTKEMYEVEGWKLVSVEDLGKLFVTDESDGFTCHLKLGECEMMSVLERGIRYTCAPKILPGLVVDTTDLTIFLF